MCRGETTPWRNIVRKNEDNLGGVRWITAGFFIIALTIFALQVVRIFKVWNIAEFAAIFAFFLSWLLVLWGATTLLHHNKTWKPVWILSIVMLIVVALEGFVAFRNVRNGMLEQSFIDIVVMFLFYMTLMGLFYAYRRMLFGSAMIVKAKDAVLARKCMRTWLPCCALVMLTLIIIPITGMFTKTVEYVGTLSLGAIGFLAQMYMCKLLLDSHWVVKGKEKRKLKEGE